MGWAYFVRDAHFCGSNRVTGPCGGFRVLGGATRRFVERLVCNYLRCGFIVLPASFCQSSKRTVTELLSRTGASHSRRVDCQNVGC
ncbi:hypothetical protein EC9_03150 [Rosistilla ulvae]|uniref:Uncharacterized protein n=1 Tax=Rosistilla ulvae TaxID=1930277 RepID=A0A517LU70_9BACT|nr:hypothetical protein EC9_03150 [Rosistilla ulvae]